MIRNTTGEISLSRLHHVLKNKICQMLKPGPIFLLKIANILVTMLT